MSNYQPNRYHQATQESTPQRTGGRQPLFALVGLVLLVAGMLMGFTLFEDKAEPTVATKAAIQIAAPVVGMAPTVSAVAKPLALPLSGTYQGLVGIVAGHKGYDPGAVCPDGLTEAQVNETVATEVVNLLERRGIQADLLAEFDERLTEYKADALVSIHADSCSVPGVSGFKVARVTDSAIPQAEDLLVNCLNDEYGQYTGLPQHPATITDNMTDYHAFREIARQTPGAIIEIGFLLDDRFLLESKPKIVARGIAAGILCFLDQAPANSQPITEP